MLVWALTVWLGLAGFYLFLAGDISSVEIVGSAVCASLGTALAAGLSRVRLRHFAGSMPLHALLRPAAAVFPETFIVGRQLVAAMISRVDRRGVFVRQPFEPGANDDPKTATRRALAVIGVSLAPRSFVIRGEASETMLLHALPEKPASQNPRWPA